MKKILIATGNPGKRREMLACFQGLEGFEFLSLEDFPPVKEPEERGTTFEENALQKAEFFGQHFGVRTLGEDSGLILSAFPDKFGLRTRREIDSVDDNDWLTQFLEMMEGVEDRKAVFYSGIAFYDPETKTSFATLGQTAGEIVDFPQAPLEKGVPVSAVFIPEGEMEVYSAMTQSKKNSLSHRGKSAEKMKKFLKKWENISSKKQ